MRYSLDTGRRLSWISCLSSSCCGASRRVMPASTWGWPHVGLQRQPSAVTGPALATPCSPGQPFLQLPGIAALQGEVRPKVGARYLLCTGHLVLPPHLDPSRLPHQSRPFGLMKNRSWPMRAMLLLLICCFVSSFTLPAVAAQPGRVGAELGLVELPVAQASSVAPWWFS